LKIIKKVKQKGSTCPKKRPDEEGHCDDGYYKKNNSHRDECCYKIKNSGKNPGKQ
jgi:hypothetical protein